MLSGPAAPRKFAGSVPGKISVQIDQNNELEILQLNRDVESFCGKAIYRQLHKEIVKTVTGFFG